MDQTGKRKRAKIAHELDFEVGSGNVFEDIGLPDPEERLARADLALRISDAVRARRLTQTAAAKLFGIDQPKVSRLLNGQLAGFSTDRLMHFLTLLGRDIEIVVKPAAQAKGRGRLRVIGRRSASA
jgi:predicted XRE-type DNA-binding protein